MPWRGWPPWWRARPFTSSRRSFSRLFGANPAVGYPIPVATAPKQPHRNFTNTTTAAAAHIGPAAAHANGEEPSQAGTMVTATSLHLTAAGKHSSDRAVIPDHGHRSHERRV